jgi:hypothetical protein
MFDKDYLSLSHILKNRWRIDKDVSFTSKCLTKQEQLLLEEVGANINVKSNEFTITVKRGTATDLASVPRFLWWFLSPWDIAKAAVLHDHTHQAAQKYKSLKQYNRSKYIRARKVSNKLFLCSMKTLEIKPSTYKIYLAYLFVCATTKIKDILGA